MKKILSIIVAKFAFATTVFADYANGTEPVHLNDGGTTTTSMIDNTNVIQEGVDFAKLMEIFGPKFREVFTIGLSVVVAFYVVLTGFHIIKNHKDKDEVKKALTSFLFIALGTLIIASAAIIASYLMYNLQFEGSLAN